MEISWLLITILCMVSALALISKIIPRHNPNGKLPPGPKPWPIFGNLNLIGSIPHQSLHLLSQNYGEIMLIKFGKFPVVVASSPEIAKQFLKMHDTVFASRPALAAGKYISYNYSDVSWAPYGPYWRQTKKIYLSEIFNARRLKSFEHTRMEEMRNFLSHLRSLSGNRVMLRDHLMHFTLSTISRIALGNKYFSESEYEKSILKVDELRGMMDEWFFLTGVFNIGDRIPWLIFFGLQGYAKRMKDLRKKSDRFLNYVIDDHLGGRNQERKGSTQKVWWTSTIGSWECITRDCVKALIQALANFSFQAHFSSH